MADIHNSIILDDRMSKPIADINAHMLELKKSMEKQMLCLIAWRVKWAA